MNTIPITPVLARGGTVQFVLRLVAFPVLLLAAPALWAQGTLDTTFNTTGKVQTTINANGDKATGVAVQSDGSNDDIVTIRYIAAGAFDTIFPTTTFSGTSHERGQALALQSDGKILVAGYTNSPGNYDFALVRFTTAGALDTTFNTTGKVITAFGTNTDRVAAMKLQADGRILVAGLYTDASFLEHTAVARYLAAPPAPDISVEQPTGTHLTDGTSTVAYGSRVHRRLFESSHGRIVSGCGAASRAAALFSARLAQPPCCRSSPPSKRREARRASHRAAAGGRDCGG